jgi:hypothetical protein
MAKLLAELDRRDREAALRLPPKTKPKTHRLGSALVAVLLLGGAGGVVYVARHHSSPAAKSSAVAADSIGGDRASALVGGRNGGPSAGVGEQRARVLPAAIAPPGSGGYKFLRNSSGELARYDPCRPIHYVVRDQNTPPGGDEAIQQAVAAVSKATGLKFIDDGATTETPDINRPAYEPARYGDRWAPVLIAWTNPTEVPRLKGDAGGLGGSWSYSDGTGHGSAYVSGHVYLDTAELQNLDQTTHGDVTYKLVIEHELGHLVGLDHVDDPHQVMYPSAHGLSGYSAGDLRGLAIAGSGACHPEL